MCEYYPTIWLGFEGIDVYEEIHQNYINQILHVAFLPFVFYGIYRGIPALLGYVDYPRYIIAGIMLMYGLFYSTFDPFSGVMTVIINLPMAYMAELHLSQSSYSRGKHLLISVFAMTSSLILLEIFGHTCLEEINSRMTVSYVLNAILYSPIYCTINLISFLPYSVIPSLIFFGYEFSLKSK